MDRYLAADVGELRRDRVRIVLQVGLREHHDRPRAALHGEREVALEQPTVELLTERMDDEHDVDVRRDDLLSRDAGRRLVSRAARDRRSARHDVDDGAGRVECDPVADDGKRRSIRRAPETARDAAAPRSRRGHDVVLAAMLHGDSSRHESLLRVRLECGAPGIVPAERREFEHGRSVPHRAVGRAAQCRPPHRSSVDARNADVDPDAAVVGRREPSDETPGAGNSRSEDSGQPEQRVGLQRPEDTGVDELE